MIDGNPARLRSTSRVEDSKIVDEEEANNITELEILNYNTKSFKGWSENGSSNTELPAFSLYM